MGIEVGKLKLIHSNCNFETALNAMKNGDFTELDGEYYLIEKNRIISSLCPLTGEKLYEGLNSYHLLSEKWSIYRK